MSFHKELGGKITTVRRGIGISQHELARRVGVAQSNVSRWEHGRQLPTVPSLARIAAATNTQLEINFR